LPTAESQHEYLRKFPSVAALAAKQCDELAPPHGVEPKARDHGLSIANHARASQQK
jgi:hypothetical protein